MPTQEQDKITRRISHGEWTESQTTFFRSPFVPEPKETVTHWDAFGVPDSIARARRAFESAGLSASPTCVGSAAGADG